MIEVNGVVLETTDSGFLLHAEEWNENVAIALAAHVGVSLTEGHWEIVRFIRNYYLNFNHLPNARVFTKAVQKALGEDKGNSLYLHRLFPGGPLKHACLIAGLPRPPGCI
jgi:tRNA 2-thiouridine synthesizing protein E